MAGRAVKGTNDADDDGKKGGSLPQAAEDRIARLEKIVAQHRALMAANGWTLP